VNSHPETNDTMLDESLISKLELRFILRPNMSYSFKAELLHPVSRYQTEWCRLFHGKKGCGQDL